LSFEIYPGLTAGEIVTFGQMYTASDMPQEGYVFLGWFNGETPIFTGDNLTIVIGDLGNDGEVIALIPKHEEIKEVVNIIYVIDGEQTGWTLPEELPTFYEDTGEIQYLELPDLELEYGYSAFGWTVLEYTNDYYWVSGNTLEIDPGCTGVLVITNYVSY
jgi:hypothetical protein